jgi:hypothetical protein
LSKPSTGRLSVAAGVASRAQREPALARNQSVPPLPGAPVVPLVDRPSRSRSLRRRLARLGLMVGSSPWAASRQPAGLSGRFCRCCVVACSQTTSQLDHTPEEEP